MHYLEYFNKKIIKYDLINKFLYSNTKKLPNIKKIILHFGCGNTKFKSLSSSLLALELITTKKSWLTTSKKSNVLVKIRKGNPVGCKVLLSNKLSYIFLTWFLNEIWPWILRLYTKHQLKILNLRNKKKQKTDYYYYRIDNPLVFYELEEHFYLFTELSRLDFFLVVSSKIKKKDSNFFISSLKLPNL